MRVASAVEVFKINIYLKDLSSLVWKRHYEKSKHNTQLDIHGTHLFLL